LSIVVGPDSFDWAERRTGPLKPTGKIIEKQLGGKMRLLPVLGSCVPWRNKKGGEIGVKQKKRESSPKSPGWHRGG